MKDKEIEIMAEKFKGMPYYRNGKPLSCAPQIYLKRGFIAGFKAALESMKNKVNKENKPTPEIPIDDLRYLNNL